VPLIQVFIPTYNRPTLVLNSIYSALNQSFDSYEVIVSDNSTNDETKILIPQIKDKRLSYRRRIPSLSPIDHGNTILSEVTADYFMVFHDDDIMHKNMLECLHLAFIEHENIIAVGSNALITRNGKKSTKKIFKTAKNYLILSKPIDVARRYITIGGIVPFPSYMYRKAVAQKFKLDVLKGGKYCDAAFIMDISSLGKIIFIKKALMDYSIHLEQDSNNYSYKDSTELLKYICKVTGLKNDSKLIKEFRIQNIYLELKQGILNGQISLLSKRYLSLLKIIFRKSILLYFPRTLLISLVYLFKISTKRINY
jgi:glycosyltransferase involved in cell wall biosynthesis